MALSRLCSNDTFKTTTLRTQEDRSNAVTSHNVKEQNTASMPRFSILSCAPHVHRRYGGASRDRTGDPLLAKQVLSQLSYGPLVFAWSLWTVVGLGGLEPPASPLSGVRSNHLSYRPKAFRFSSLPFSGTRRKAGEPSGSRMNMQVTCADA